MNTTNKILTKTAIPTAVRITTTVKLSSIFSQLFKQVSDREKQILEMRFGLDTHSKHTLEAIGQKFGITRERVRQIENAAVKKLSTFEKETAITQLIAFAKYVLETNGGILEKHALLKGVLTEINSDSESDMHYVELALLMNTDIITVHNTIKFHPYYYLRGIGASTVADVTSAITSSLKKKKDVIKLSEIKDTITVDTAAPLTTEVITNVCRVSKNLKVTDNDTVGLFKWTHINPRNIHDKIIFVMKEYGKPMHFEELTEFIRNRGFDDKTVNVQAVHNELIRHDDFVLIGRGIYALGAWGYTPGTVSDVITSILKDGPMERDAIIEKVLEVRQVKKITIQLNLKNKKLFERVGRNTYGLKK